MEKIDLDAIIEKGLYPEVGYKFKGDDETITLSISGIKRRMREAIHQALVLASEKATSKVYMPHGGSLTGGVDKQSILDVENLIQ